MKKKTKTNKWNIKANLVNLTSSLILDSGLRVKEVFNRLLPGVPMLEFARKRSINFNFFKDRLVFNDSDE